MDQEGTPCGAEAMGGMWALTLEMVLRVLTTVWVQRKNILRRQERGQA